MCVKSSLGGLYVYLQDIVRDDYQPSAVNAEGLPVADSEGYASFLAMYNMLLAMQQLRLGCEQLHHHMASKHALEN